MAQVAGCYSNQRLKPKKKKKGRRCIVFLKRQHFINSLVVNFNTHQLHSTPRRTFCRTSEVGSGPHEPCANTFARNNNQGSSLKEFPCPEQPLMRGGQGAEPGPGSRALPASPLLSNARPAAKMAPGRLQCPRPRPTPRPAQQPGHALSRHGTGLASGTR